MVTINKEFALGDNQGDSRVAQNMYIILHETANPKSTGRNEATYMHNNYQNAYTQFIVGDGLVYQVGEPGYVAWGALNGNPYSPVQIELQHTSDPALFKKNYAIYIELARDMANKYGIPLSLDAGGAGTKGIKTHNWITQNYGGDHTDPYGYLASMGVSKAQLASDLSKAINSGNHTESGVEVKFNEMNRQVSSDTYGLAYLTRDAKLYSKPDVKTATGRTLKQGTAWKVLSEDGNFLSIGGYISKNDAVYKINEGAKTTHYAGQRIQARTTAKLYKEPNGALTGKSINAKQGDFIVTSSKSIGGHRWFAIGGWVKDSDIYVTL